GPAPSIRRSSAPPIALPVAPWRRAFATAAEALAIAPFQSPSRSPPAERRRCRALLDGPLSAPGETALSRSDRSPEVADPRAWEVAAAPLEQLRSPTRRRRSGSQTIECSWQAPVSVEVRDRSQQIRAGSLK